MNTAPNPGETLLTCMASHFGQGKGIRRVVVVLNDIEMASLVSGWIAGSAPSRGWMEQRRICSLREGGDETTKRGVGRGLDWASRVIDQEIRWTCESAPGKEVRTNYLIGTSNNRAAVSVQWAHQRAPGI